MMYEPDELLRRGVVSAGSAFRTADVEQRIVDVLLTHPPDTVARTLAKAFTELAKPAHLGALDELVAELGEVMFDDAHENCDDEAGCTGGGKPYYDDYVKQVLGPVLQRYAVAGPGPEVCGLAECRTVPAGGCCHDVLDAEAVAR